MNSEMLSMLSTYGPIVIMFVLFYFLLIRPQNKERQKRAEMLAALHKGNKVITVGGIYGEIVKIDEKTVHLLVADGVVIKMTRSSVNANISQGISLRRDDDEPEEKNESEKED
ncbi:MAG: preprotein translocase subunit YajC [Schwartzia sp.]|nr:preprotein translocase subunit YajC [Schwartzia sp. (in: firmicutes)]